MGKGTVSNGRIAGLLCIAPLKTGLDTAYGWAALSMRQFQRLFRVASSSKNNLCLRAKRNPVGRGIFAKENWAFARQNLTKPPKNAPAVEVSSLIERLPYFAAREKLASRDRRKMPPSYVLTGQLAHRPRKQSS